MSSFDANDWMFHDINEFFRGNFKSGTIKVTEFLDSTTYLRWCLLLFVYKIEIKSCFMTSKLGLKNKFNVRLLIT